MCVFKFCGSLLLLAKTARGVSGRNSCVSWFHGRCLALRCFQTQLALLY
jgi:hypothetical protein